MSKYQITVFFRWLHLPKENENNMVIRPLNVYFRRNLKFEFFHDRNTIKDVTKNKHDYNKYSLNIFLKNAIR